MKLAYTMTEGKGDLDAVLYHFAQAQIKRGLRVGGVVQVNTDRDDCPLCDMDVQVLPDGPTYRISQNLGKEARGCRLDPEALEQSVAEVGARLNADLDLLVLNKFGKHEAGGRGFRDTIGQALALGVPVVCGVNSLNRAALEDFCDGMAEYVAPSSGALEKWLAT
ncbi:DUF2478 domain-containing protein [Cognatishimia sp. WU-CL00825]|uniref:DUF2478 domain-containing protein n=1 Tax=Cognatishimia sp. WU-CL00825 TaxID=3127658 RepID=UPI003107FA18